nr:MAG TPA: hypothetical protein [Bacteriophage sp.]
MPRGRRPVGAVEIYTAMQSGQRPGVACALFSIQTGD